MYYHWFYDFIRVDRKNFISNNNNKTDVFLKTESGLYYWYFIFFIGGSMSIKPINMMMAITQSQTLKPPDSDHNIKYAQHAQTITNQHQKNKESVVRIPDDENHTEIMDTIKQGMNDFQEDTNNSQHHHKEEDLDIPEKSLLDDDNGHSIDIIG